MSTKNTSESETKYIYPHCFDPLGGSTPRELRALLTLHLLLFPGVVVQDNFLISALFHNTMVDEGIVFRDYIEAGLLKVALREGQFGLIDLKDYLLSQALAGKFRPFEGYDAGTALYQFNDFLSYLNELDQSLSTKNAILSWNANLMGQRYGSLMKQSAESGVKGLSVERCLEIWRLVDENKPYDSNHSRTLYWNFAKALTNQDERMMVENWATLYYLQNLPSALDIDLSAPNNVFGPVQAWDPFEELKALGSHTTEERMIFGRDCALLNPDFLLHLKFADIQKIRSFQSFRDLQKARSNGKPEHVARALTNYLREVGDQSPDIYGPYKRELSTLRAHVNIIMVLGVGTAVVVSNAVPNGIIKAPLDVLTMVLPLCLGSQVGSQARLKKTRDASSNELRDTRYKQVDYSFADFCHEVNRSH